MKDIIKSLNWRYATKKYNPSQKISKEDMSTLMEATKLSVSSMGLQPYKILVVEDEAVRAKLSAAAYGQSPIVDASAVFVFAIESAVGDNEIDAYMNNISETRKVPIASLDGFRNAISSFIGNFSDEERDNWAKKQTYIALSTLINTASILNIDATPMEGFDAQKFDEILGLSTLNLKTSVIATLGYRHQDDATQHFVKVRKSDKNLFIKI